MNRTILLVDDDIFQLKLFERLLSSNGYNCKIAVSVDEAEKILQTETPDLIISDYEMPEKDGFDFRRGLLKEDSRKDIPFLFLTSVSDHYIIQQGLDLKAIDYIVKNTPASQVLSKIDNLLQAVREHYGRFLSSLKITTEKLNIRNIPRNAPVLKKFEIKYFNQSFQNQPGSDFIDFISIGDQFTFIILGEVMEKKTGGCILSYSLLSYIRATIRLSVKNGDLSLMNILSKLNNLVYEDEILNNIFSTLSIILLDDKLGQVSYAGAGDMPLLKYSSSKNSMESFNSNGLLLGFSEKDSFNEVKITMDKGDEIYLISDGMTDFETDGYIKSDIQQLKEKILDLKVNDGNADALISRLFKHHIVSLDDCSIIVLSRK